jgi:hypothetical protein
MNKKTAIALCLININIFAYANNFDDVLQQLKIGNASGLVKMFNNNVELTLLETEGIYSKQQAEVMLRNFFNQHPPKQVVLQHKGTSSKGAMYGIMIYESNTAKFRTYIFMKDNGYGMQINEFRIERD